MNRAFARLAVKHSAAAALWATGALGLPSRRQRVLILSLHRVVEDFQTESRRGLPALLMGASTFRRLCQEVARRWDVVPLPVAAREALAPRGPRVAAITFDDGYRDVYDVALPVLRSLGMGAAVYLPTDFVSGAGPLLHDRLYALLAAARQLEVEAVCLPQGPGALLAAGRRAVGRDPHPLTDWLCARRPRAALVSLCDALERTVGPARVFSAPMTWSMARELANLGWEVGAHTVGHVPLPYEPARVMIHELGVSRAQIEGHVGRPCRHFAYPNGVWSAAAQRAVREAGFESAVTTEDRPCEGGADPLALPRKALWEQACLGVRGRFSRAVAASNLAGAFGWLGLTRPVPGRMADAVET